MRSSLDQTYYIVTKQHGSYKSAQYLTLRVKDVSSLGRFALRKCKKTEAFCFQRMSDATRMARKFGGSVIECKTYTEFTKLANNNTPATRSNKACVAEV